MEGGAMRGLFTCGVIDVFMENNITFDCAAGVSAGAVFGCNFKSRQIGRPLRYNKKYCTDSRYVSFKNFFTTGDLYGVDFCYHELPDRLDVFDRKTFRENPMEFWLCATNVETGQAEYHLCTDGEDVDIEWMRASASIPVLSRVVEIDGLKLLDGGTADPVPYRFMTEQQGCDRSITVLTQPAGFQKKKSSSLPLIRLALRKYPRLVAALADRPERYNALYAHIEQEQSAGKALIIRPPEPLGVGSMEKNPDELERVYQIGRRTAEAMLDQVKAFLSAS